MDLAHETALATRVLAATGLAAGANASFGHVSIRDPQVPGQFLVKGRGYAIDVLSRMRAEDMVRCDLDGNLLAGQPGTTQCFEVMLHARMLARRSDVGAVVHAHPRFLVLMTTLGRELVPVCLEGAGLVTTPLPVYPHCHLISARSHGDTVAEMAAAGPAVLLRGHGAVTVGKDAEEAIMAMVLLEEQARMNWYALCAMGPDHPRIPAEQLVETRKQMRALPELPHFAGTMHGGIPSTGGAWADLMARAAEQYDAGDPRST